LMRDGKDAFRNQNLICASAPCWASNGSIIAFPNRHIPVRRGTGQLLASNPIRFWTIRTADSRRCHDGSCLGTLDLAELGLDHNRRHLPAPADLSNLFSLLGRFILDSSDTRLYSDPLVSHSEKKCVRRQVLDVWQTRYGSSICAMVGTRPANSEISRKIMAYNTTLLTAFPSLQRNSITKVMVPN